MTREHYVQELREVQDKMLIMGSMVAQALRDGMDALRRQDADAAWIVVAGDRNINARRYRLEEDCLMLIATQQPMARDLRMLAGVLEIASELERMGDYAKGLAKITLFIGKEPLVKPLVHMPQMCEKAIAMLQDALEAYVNQDIKAAHDIPKRDDEVDELYNLINRELLDIMIKNPSKIDHANYLSWAAHNLERAADRVTNICERIIYTATGEFVEMDVDEADLAGVN